MISPITIGPYQVGPDHPLTVFCGPCVIESEEHCLQCAKELQEIFSAFPIQFIFKSSYDKANRSSIHSFRGPGLNLGLTILDRVKQELNLPIVTDVHSPYEATAAAEVCDVLQIPAFLCRQTDLLVAAAGTGRVVKIKKGQFLSPWDMEQVVNKVTESGNSQILLTDRGTSFGYNNLVSDFRSIPIMAKLGYPVCFDATHSVQLPGGQGATSGGQREFVFPLARAAMAVGGCHALFLEAHPNPSEAKSDAATVLSFSQLPNLLQSVVQIYEVMNTADSMTQG